MGGKEGGGKGRRAKRKETGKGSGRERLLELVYYVQYMYVLVCMYAYGGTDIIHVHV